MDGRDTGPAEQLIGRCYTRARRLPLMIGRLPGAQGELWGGPYTLTQVVVFCAGLLLLWQVRGLWAHLGGVGNGLVLLGVPALAAWTARRARIEGRDPLRAGLGVAGFLTAPAHGRLGGRPWRQPRPHLIRRSRFFVTPTTAAPTGPGQMPAPATAVQALLAAARTQRRD